MDTKHLPEPLRGYVTRAVRMPPGSGENTGSVHMAQRGEMRLAPQGAWMPFTAEQSTAVDRTRFLWHARVKLAPFVTAVVEDGFQDGHGRLDAKVFGLIPLAHGEGPLLDRGEAQRYLAELAWCPLACVYNRELQYRALDPQTVRAFIGDEVCHVDLGFDAAGDLSVVRTDTRARGEDIQPWEGRFSGFRDFGDLRAPALAEVAWQAPEGRFVYWKGEVLSLEWVAT